MRFNQLGPWVVVIPVLGGIVVGLMAKFGSSKIKGHGIPEAMEAVLFNRSRAVGAVFGAASRATFAFIIFAFEITRDYNAVLPLMLVSVLADGIAMVLMPRASIMTEKLARRGLHIHQEYETDILRQVKVREMMDVAAPTISAQTTVSELAERIVRRDVEVSRHQALLAVDNDGKLETIITRGDILRALDSDPCAASSVLAAGSPDVIVTYPDETLSEAVHKMQRHSVGRLPVVERGNPRKILGYLGRPNIMAAHLRRMEEEHVREPGWFPGRERTAIPLGQE